MARRKGNKVEKFHSEAKEEVYELLDSVIENHHSDLGDTAFLILMKHGGWKSKGKPVLGKVQILNDAFRRSMKRDAIIYLNSDVWLSLSKPQRVYLLDHLMYSLDVATDRHSDVKTAADGRPLLTTSPHDFEGYADVVKRHGPIMQDIKRLLSGLRETNQLTIEEVAAGAEQPAVPPHEGITGTIDPDGTIQVDDKNQVTIEQAAAEAQPDTLPVIL
ncbi:putative metallopeptidase [Cohnella yongneupensis]|uniref:Metallopeptidase n=1 Tax=Cohnella yongneupensis TaxID=425006 RepID=A0ABW0QTV9_9BACL